MKITIHRGIEQIGGCITEIESASGTKILIDLGHNLPEGDKLAEDVYDSPKKLEELLQGVSHIFYSHFHGDHIGFEAKIPSSITQHIGELSLEMLKTLKRHMTYAKDLKEEASASLMALNRFQTYQSTKEQTYGDIKVTPYPVSHSAIDAYMFVIECDGKRVLHTGDFRDHGYRAKDFLADIETKVSDIDVLITEGTMLDRTDKRMQSEQKLQDKAFELFNEQSEHSYKYAFVLCSSMDADRLVSFFQASQRANKKRRFLADHYQIGQLLRIKKSLHAPYNELFAYNIRKDKQEELKRMKRYGFTLLVRNSDSFRELIDEIMETLQIDPQEVVFIYSQYAGYIDKTRPTTFKHSLYDFVHRYPWRIEHLHTSGHASKEALKSLCEHVQPTKAIIPIHKERKGSFEQLKLYVKCPIVESDQSFDNIDIVIR